MRILPKNDELPSDILHRISLKVYADLRCKELVVPPGLHVGIEESENS